MILTDKDRNLILMWREYRKRGSMGSVRDINETYQRVFADNPNRKFRTFTTCSTCLGRMVAEMSDALDTLDGLMQVPQGTVRTSPTNKYRLMPDGTLAPVENKDKDGGKGTTGQEAHAVTA